MTKKRHQISTSVPETTRLQVERMMKEKGYSITTLVVLGIQRLYDEQDWSKAGDEQKESEKRERP